MFQPCLSLVAVGCAYVSYTVGLIDIDCTTVSGFDEVDKKYLEILAGVLAEGCDW